MLGRNVSAPSDAFVQSHGSSFVSRSKVKIFESKRHVLSHRRISAATDGKERRRRHRHWHRRVRQRAVAELAVIVSADASKASIRRDVAQMQRAIAFRQRDGVCWQRTG